MEALKKLAARSSYDVPVGRAVLVGLQSPTYEAVHDPLTHLEVVAKDVAKLVEKMCEERRREHRPQEEELKEVLPAIGLRDWTEIGLPQPRTIPGVLREFRW